jgi:hypothetical protein
MSTLGKVWTAGGVTEGRQEENENRGLHMSEGEARRQFLSPSSAQGNGTQHDNENVGLGLDQTTGQRPRTTAPG